MKHLFFGSILCFLLEGFAFTQTVCAQSETFLFIDGSSSVKEERADTRKPNALSVLRRLEEIAMTDGDFVHVAYLYEHTTQRGNLTSYELEYPDRKIPDRTPNTLKSALQAKHEQELRSTKKRFNRELAALVLTAPTKGIASCILASLELVAHRRTKIGAIPAHLIYVSDMQESSELGSISPLLTDNASTPEKIKAEGKRYATKVREHYQINFDDLSHVESVTIILPTRLMETEAAYRNVGFFYDSFFGEFGIQVNYTH